MDVDDVAGPNDAGIVEIPRFEEQRVEGAEFAARRVAAGDVKLHSQPRPRGNAVKAVADRRRESPREDVLAAEMPKLNDRLDVVVEPRRLAK